MIHNRLNEKYVRMKPRVWRTQFTNCSSVDMRNISHFFLFLKKQRSQQITRCCFIIFLPSKLHQVCHFLLKNIILHQKLHKHHENKFYQLFENILTFQIPLGYPLISVIFSLFIFFQNTNKVKRSYEQREKKFHLYTNEPKP